MWEDRRTGPVRVKNEPKCCVTLVGSMALVVCASMFDSEYPVKTSPVAHKNI